MPKATDPFPHRYRRGDLLGVTADCMADCRVVQRVRKKPGDPLGYVVTPVRIHHPNPEQSWFSKNPRFFLPEARVVVCLARAERRTARKSTHP